MAWDDKGLDYFVKADLVLHKAWAYLIGPWQLPYEYIDNLFNIVPTQVI